MYIENLNAFDYEIDEESELVCIFCENKFDYEFWIGDETCKHCGKFLDNPPNLKRQKETSEGTA